MKFSFTLLAAASLALAAPVQSNEIAKRETATPESIYMPPHVFSGPKKRDAEAEDLYRATLFGTAEPEATRPEPVYNGKKPIFSGPKKRDAETAATRPEPVYNGKKPIFSGP